MHCPVLLSESIQALNIQSDGIYIDATFGRGGHSQAILKHLSSAGRLIVFDKDPEAIQVAKALNDARIIIHHGSFADLAQVAEQHGYSGQVAGIFMDLGVSSPQLDQAERGFSFMHDGPLDMRMDSSQGQTAADWVNHAEEKDIVHVLRVYGEERFAKRIAHRILLEREEAPIETTSKLAQIISDAIPKHDKHKHPATRSFQAIRIEVNQELADLEALLTQSIDVLKPGGRLAAISFHSLEDRIVKQFINKAAQGDQVPSHIPIRGEAENKLLRKIGKPIVASEKEISENARSRSARLRVAEKI